MTPRRISGGSLAVGLALAFAKLLLVSGLAAAQEIGGLRIGNVIWVPAASAPGDVGVSNCQRLRATLASLPPSSYQVVRLPPGIFQCDSEPLVVPTFVTLEGSGNWRTYISGFVDQSSRGVIHLQEGATLSRVWVENGRVTPAVAAIAVSASDPIPVTQSTIKLVDVRAEVHGSPGYPLRVAGGKIQVERGEFSGGDIRLVGGGFLFTSFTLFGSAFEQIDADASGVAASCYFYRDLISDAAFVGGGCP